MHPSPLFFGLHPDRLFWAKVHAYGAADTKPGLDTRLLSLQGYGQAVARFQAYPAAVAFFRGYPRRAFLDPNLVGGEQVGKGDSSDCLQGFEVLLFQVTP